MLFVCQSCKYAFNDHWKGSLGGNLFRVEENTFYGRLRDNSNLHMEIKYSF
jgi:transposase-like protein